MLKKTLTTFAVATVLSISSTAHADTTFNVSTYAPYAHPVVSVGLVNWAQEVEKETNGRVKMNILQTALGQPQAHYDMAVSGIADVTLGVPGYTPGKFHVVEVSGVPGAGNSSTGLSVALWRAYEKFPAFQEEFSDVVVLGLFTTSPMHFYNAERPIKAIDDFKGLKSRVAGGMMADVATAIGLTPVLQPAGKVYELLDGGIIDAVIFPRETIKSFKLENLLKYATIVPGGLTAVPLFLVMNKAKFESLSKDDQDALMRASGENLSRINGKVWDERDQEGIDLLRSTGGVVETAEGKLLEQIETATAPVVEKWVSDVSTQADTDAAKILEYYREQVKAVEKGM